MVILFLHKFQNWYISKCEESNICVSWYLLIRCLGLSSLYISEWEEFSCFADICSPCFCNNKKMDIFLKCEESNICVSWYLLTLFLQGLCRWQKSNLVCRTPWKFNPDHQFQFSFQNISFSQKDKHIFFSKADHAVEIVTDKLLEYLWNMNLHLRVNMILL